MNDNLSYNLVGTDSASSATTSGISGTLGAISAGVEIASGIATTISGIVDQAKRRKFEQSLALLTSQQQKELNEKLLAANSQTERLQILSNSMVSYAAANQAAAVRSKITLYIIAGALGIAILGLAMFVIKND